MKALSLVSLVLMIAAGPLAAQTTQAPEPAVAEQPLTAKEIRKLRSDIQRLETQIVMEIRNSKGGFGRAESRMYPGMMTDDPAYIDNLGKPVRDAVPVSATHQKQLIELRALDAKLKAAGVPSRH